MRCRLDHPILLLHPEDVPPYKKTGSVVRNNYFWALRSIADRALRGQPWEFDQCVWIALSRLLTTFAESGYLGYSETLLAFPPEAEIPEVIRTVSTWGDSDEPWG
ncbi:MAG: hypothetical protein O3A14_17040 [Cyanobacteria bacterium]|nr:hypothetical protein [Cyanobacteriota bacterium]